MGLSRVRRPRAGPGRASAAPVAAGRGPSAPRAPLPCARVSGIEKHHDDWEQLAELDPMWAILSSPERRFGGWDEAEFFATGDQEVARLLARIDELGGLNGRAAALDFGCGVGRVSRAF